MSDRRNAWHQRYCKEVECQRVSKAASQRRWLSRKENRNYFRSHENVERVREWRAKNPDYWRRKGALQEVVGVQPSDSISKKGVFAASRSPPEAQEVLALQEIIHNQPLVLIGLISKFTGTTLQDDIALTSRHLLRLGQDIVQGVRRDDTEAAHLSGARAPGASTI